MSTKIIFDGTLFSECELMGSNRSGMLRLAEDITRNLIEKEELIISFLNTVSNDQYDDLLKKFINQNYPSKNVRILLKQPLIRLKQHKVKSILRSIITPLGLHKFSSKVEDFDIFHSYYYPFTDDIENRRIKKSITFLDIIPLKMNGYPGASINITKKIVESIVPNFAISISEFSRHDLIDYDKRISPERVFVAPLAASKALFFQNNNILEWKVIKDKYGLPDKYFLSVSSNDNRKNLPHLIRSFSKFIKQQNHKDLFLVLTGNFTYSYSILEELNIDKAVREKIIITKKHIENQDLSVIYSNALCFFFMSLYEGFGLPVLEAMQCGTPVVTSNVSSLPEVVGAAGIMLPPKDEDALCDIMNKLYLNKELRDNYSCLGLQRAKQFSWQRCANEYAEIFKKIAEDF